MQTVDQLLRKEFKATLAERKNSSQIRGITVTSMPVPLDVIDVEMGKTEGIIVKVKGIELKYFNQLNDSFVHLYEGVKLTKRLTDSDGNVVTLQDGKPAHTPVIIPKQCVAIVTDINIHVPVLGYTKTMFFVDYVDTKKKRYYIYVVEKQYLYKVNLNALLLSEHKKANYYKGCKVAFQTGDVGYLYVVPFVSMKEYTTSRILAVKPKVSFDEEINKILRFWQEHGVIFDLKLLAISDEENLGISYFRNQEMIDNYREYKGVYK